MTADAQEFAALLRERRVAAERALSANAEGSLSILAARGDGTADDEHDPEGSTLSGEWSLLEGLRVDAERDLVDIDAALARIESGDYGRCEACGRDIPPERLRARPTALLCVPCAEKL